MTLAMPTFSPLTGAAAPIPMHAIAAVASLFTGLLQFALPKGTRLHRVVGWGWVLSMALVAVSSFWINGYRLFGPFSPIHLLSVLTLFGLFRMVQLARTGRVNAHRKVARILFFYALILAGIFTFLPGRIMHNVLFGEQK